MSQLQAKGGQPQKAPKYADIYQGRFFNGLNTNRSPLRAASASHIAETFYSDTSGDALIAGENIEVTNRLTLARRPGNPIYDNIHTYNAPDAFDNFRVNKAQSDVFGTTLESIFTMIDEGGSGTDYLYSLNQSFQRGGDAGYYYGLKFQKASGAGQTFMQSVGNSLYFGNGVQNKKWLTSLFVRTSAGNNSYLQGSDGLAGTYPFGTFLIDPATGNIQEFIGISIGSATNVAVSDNVITITVGTLTVPPSSPTTIPVGSSFQLWGFTTSANTWLNGATITLTTPYTYGSSTTLVADLEHVNYTSSESGPAYILQAGTTPYIAKTGGSVPTWGTTQPQASNLFMGSLTEDGNTIWINRGVNYGDGQQPSVMNWGIKAPTTAPSYAASGSAVSWQKDTYYSPASIYVDPVSGNLWQITTPGVTGATQPSWPASPTAQQKVVILSAYSDGTDIYFTTATQSPALASGDTVVLQNMLALGANIGGSSSLPNLNGVSLTVSATGLTTTAFRAPYTANVFGSSAHPIVEYGQALKTNAATTQADNIAVWTCIQKASSLTWTAHTHYNVGDFIVSPSKFLFQLGPKTTPWLTAEPIMQYLTEPASLQNSSYQGAFPFDNSGDPAIGSRPSWQSQSPSTQTLESLWLQRTLPPGQGSGTTPFGQNAVNGAGEVGANSNLTTVSSSWVGTITAYVFIPQPGNYTFTCQHNDGAMFCFDSAQVDPNTVAPGAKCTFRSSNNNIWQTISPQKGFGAGVGGAYMAGTNISGNIGPGPFNQTASVAADSATWSFPQAGQYAIEIDFAKWYHSGGYMIFMSPGSGGAPAQTLALGPLDESGTTSPTWPAFTTSGASYDTTTEQIVWGAKVTEVTNAGQQYTWNNLGPMSDYVWMANTNYTLPNTKIIDSNGNQEGPYETGITASTQPTWQTGVSAITKDNPNLQWINEGSVPAQTQTGNTITATSQQGWIYWIALVNTLDQTVSNVGPVSLPTGPVDKGQITFPAGSGLNIAAIDPQADYVAIFRSTDGFTTPLLIPGFVNSPYTVPLTQYLRNGYVDEVPDTELNNLEQGAQAGENTPPATGAKNLTYHLSRIWYSIGDTVYYTTGPLAPIGNGTDGVAPSNYAECSSQVQRLVPVSIGMLVFTVSDVYIIAGNGTTTSPILPAIPYFPGVGLANYNALDNNGGLIGLFTTDKQFILFNPSAGLDYIGFNIGDQFRKNNGTPGQSWNTQNVYVAWHINGEDQAWYVADGINGWYRVIATPAPEQGNVTWSPFAALAGSAGAIASVETAPGVHNLLIGQTTSTANILARDLDATTDNGSQGGNGSTYSAYGVIGSIVLAQPGQIAKIAFIATDSVNVGSPLILGVILDEALPYYTGSFDILKSFVADPPNLPPSKSIKSQRFYLSDNREDAAYCRHLQILVQWPPEAAPNELQTLTIFGAYEVEQ
jgi:hypothetical protein